MHVYAFLLTGLASWYSMPGSRMANGQRFNPRAHICAMRTEPLGERVTIVNAENGRESWCVISDRGPYVAGRVIDVSPAVRDDLGMGGLARVRIYRTVRYVPRGAPTPIVCDCFPPAQPLLCSCTP